MSEIQDTLPETNIVYLKDFKKPKESFVDFVPNDFDGDHNDYIDNVTLSVTFELTEILNEYGFDIRDVPNTAYDLMMVIEGVKSMIYRTQSEYYPLQDICEELFEIDNPELLVNDFLDGE
jgi:hypothetical protein